MCQTNTYMEICGFDNLIENARVGLPCVHSAHTAHNATYFGTNINVINIEILSLIFG